MNALARLRQWYDRLRFAWFSATPNGARELVANYEAVDDACDTMKAALAALEDGDTEEAAKLLELGIESTHGHIETLKGLM